MFIMHRDEKLFCFKGHLVVVWHVRLTRELGENIFEGHRVVVWHVGLM